MLGQERPLDWQSLDSQAKTGRSESLCTADGRLIQAHAPRVPPKLSLSKPAFARFLRSGPVYFSKTKVRLTRRKQGDLILMGREQSTEVQSNYAWKKAFAFALAASCVVLLYWLRTIVLLVFLAVLLGIVLDSLSRLAERYLRLPRTAALILGTLVFICMVLGSLALILVPIAKEGGELAHSLPAKWSKAEKRLDQYRKELPWLNEIWPGHQQEQPKNSGVNTPELAKRALFTATAAVDWGANALATFFLGLFFAWSPERWLKGVAQLWPGPPLEQRIRLMRKIGDGLKSYLFTLALYIVIMGAAWTLGLWLIGLEYPLLFGAIGGLAEVVPYVGPMVAFVPPLLLSLSEGTGKIIYVCVLYVVLHIVEGYVLVPYLMHQREHLPPPVVILSILVCGTLFGTLGVVLAVPLGTAAYIILNETVYSRRSGK